MTAARRAVATPMAAAATALAATVTRCYDAFFGAFSGLATELSALALERLGRGQGV
jgi:hypothetical protein